MKYFCKGAFVGMAVGILAGAVIVVKNKKLANGLKENLEKFEKKTSQMAESVMKKLKEKKQEKEQQSSGENNENSQNSLNTNENSGCCNGGVNSQNCNCGY